MKNKQYVKLLTPISKSVPQDTDHIYKSLKCKLLPSIDLKPDVHEVDNQLTIGSCTANAVTSALELLLKTNGQGRSLSRLFNYWTTRYIIENRPGEEGATVRDAVRSCKHFGVCNEDEWKYDISKVNEMPNANAFGKSLYQKVTKYEVIDENNLIYDIKSALNENIAVPFSMKIGEKWVDLKGPWRKHNYPAVGRFINKSLGGHAMVIIGYDDEVQKFLIENSWGSNWGDGGFAGLPYETLLKDIYEAFIIKEFCGMINKSDIVLPVNSIEEIGDTCIFDKIKQFFRGLR